MGKSVIAPLRNAAATPRGEVRRDHILKAASDLLLDEGYAGFSVRGVAARAGVRLSHVQYYFPDPADIVAALLDRFVVQYSREVMARFRAGADAPALRLTKALDYLLNDEAYRRECAVFMLEVSSFAARNGKIAAALRRYYAVYLDAVATILWELNPKLTAGQRRQRGLQCIALIEGIALTRLSLGREGDITFTARSTARAIQRLASMA
jgi:AcrR family transcriptional regulator